MRINKRLSVYFYYEVNGKMRFNRKAQAAMEFLMTYGWAILVVLVVIGALVYMGVLNPLALVPEKCTAPAGFICNSASLTSGGQFQLIITPQVYGNNLAVTGLNTITPTTITAPALATLNLSSTNLAGSPITITGTFGGTLTSGRKARISYDLSYQDDFGATKPAHGGEIVVTIS